MFIKSWRYLGTACLGASLALSVLANPAGDGVPPGAAPKPAARSAAGHA